MRSADSGASINRIELTHHLGQSHRTQRRQNDHPQQPPRIRPEPRGKAAIHVRIGIRRNRSEFIDSSRQTTLGIQHGKDDGYDTEEHDDTLDEIVHSRRLVASDDDVDCREDGHDDNTILIGDIKTHLKET